MDRSFDYVVPPDLEGIEVGSLVRVPFGHRRVRGVVVALEDHSDDDDERALEAIAGVVMPEPVAPPPMERLATWLADRYVAPRGRCFARLVPPRVRMKLVERAGIVSTGAVSTGAEGALRSYEGGLDLAAALSQRRAGAWCVRPAWGTDRGALIAQIVDAALARPDGQCIVTVPEVHYGSAIVDHLTSVWPAVARLDSGRSDAERAASWKAMARGWRLGAGGRSAVLTTAPDLAVMVIDEEHHHSYKEDRSPRYDARRVAIERAALQGSTCVFVTPSPSVELGAGVRGGRISSVVPPRSAARSARPVVEFVSRPPERALSHELHERIRDALRAGGRVAVLVPAAGFARALWCATCKRSVRCPRCEAGVFFDRNPRRVRCPRCGWSSTPPDRCPSCGASDFRYLGAGSERFADQLARAFPRAAVARADPEVLSEGRPDVEADIYVTTWIGTKAAIRPKVALVGVIDADGLTRRPDFRAAEHAYQALAEMAEWAGPAHEGGHLLIQTSEPSHHALQAIARADYDYFLTRELAAREELGYPPFSELVKVTASGSSARSAIGALADAAPRSARVLGPIEVRIGGTQPALQILIKCPAAMEVARLFRPIVQTLPSDVRVRIDVDPR